MASKSAKIKLRVMELQSFVDGIQTPVQKLSVKELRERELFWRALWSWLGDDVRYFVLRVGQQVRIMRRDYRGSLGELGSVKFEPREIELAVYEKSYNYNDGKMYYEDKVVKIPMSVIAWLEFIASQTPEGEIDTYEVESIPETEEVR